MPDLLSRLKALFGARPLAGSNGLPLDRDAEDKAREKRALIYTILMHLLLVVFIIISIQWKNTAPQAMQAEIWTPQQLAAATAAANANAQPKAQTYGDPSPEPTPPKLEPKPEPKPEPVKTPPKPTPAPANQKPDIAIKQDKKPKKEKTPEKVPDKKDPKTKELKETKDTKDDKKKAELRKMQDEMLAEIKRGEQKAEAQKKQAARAQREAAMRAQAGAEASAASASRTRGDNTKYETLIGSVIRRNTVLPPNIQGNPEIRFKIIQNSEGAILKIQLVKSSGNPQLDEAVERAIRRSEPLPRPEKWIPEDHREINYRFFAKPPE